MIEISVVIPSVGELPTLYECLTALGGQHVDFEYEIIVVDRTRKINPKYFSEYFPQVKIINLSVPRGIPEMRAIGIAESVGKFVAIIEDHCIVPENWLAGILEAHKSGYSVIGGAVENGNPKKIIDWAVFLCEYSSFMPPIADGETDFITGNNTSYKRDLFEKLDDSLIKNYWEYFLQAELKRRGVKFLSVSGLAVNHKKESGFLYFLSQRFHYSRSFAAMRKQESPFLKQVSYLLYLPILPFHQIWRISQNVFRKKRNYREFFLSLPLILIFMCSYALGEFVGQIFGKGDSLLKVE